MKGVIFFFSSPHFSSLSFLPPSFSFFFSICFCSPLLPPFTDLISVDGSIRVTSDEFAISLLNPESDAYRVKAQKYTQMVSETKFLGRKKWTRYKLIERAFSLLLSCLHSAFRSVTPTSRATWTRLSSRRSSTDSVRAASKYSSKFSLTGDICRGKKSRDACPHYYAVISN